MAYVAIAAAAIARTNDLLVSVVWWLTISAAGFAMLRDWNNGPHRGAAAGFVLFAILNIAAFSIVPQRTPGGIALHLAGYEFRDFDTESGFFSVSPDQVLHSAGKATISTPNALGTMAAGFVGAVFGIAAFKPVGKAFEFALEDEIRLAGSDRDAGGD